MMLRLRAVASIVVRHTKVFLIMGFSISLIYRRFCLPWRSSPKRGFDLLSVTAHELQVQLTTGKLTSAELVELYLEQIKKHDGYLHAVIELFPEVRQRADFLDAERRMGIFRGPLHGIPILIKDNIATHPDLKMNTTGGSLALVGSRPVKNAEIVDRILDAGMIILGKSQLSEFSGAKGTKIFPGWSAVGGQTQSAYTIGDVDLNDTTLGHSSPAGSSTGSAVAVSAGYCPVALGSDTFGSLITPSTRAAIYTLRPTMNLVSRQGIVPVSHLFDTAGPMAKSVIDLANLLDVLISPDSKRKTGYYSEALSGGLEDMNIGVLRPEDWFFDTTLQKPISGATTQIVADTYKGYAKIKSLAKSVQEVSLISPDELIVDGSHSLFDLISAGFKENIEKYLQTLQTSKVRTLQELIQFNKDHAEVELPPGYGNQDQLVRAESMNMSDQRRSDLFQHARRISRDLGIDKTLRDYGVDVIIAPADCAFNLLISAAGYPSATMPLSYLDYNGRPIGLAVFTTAHKENLLLKVLSAWEKHWTPRCPPPSLEN